MFIVTMRLVVQNSMHEHDHLMKYLALTANNNSIIIRVELLKGMHGLDLLTLMALCKSGRGVSV